MMHKEQIFTVRKATEIIKEAEKYKREWHGRIYDDGCWWVDVERHPYGQIRIWAGFEDKRSGRSNASIVTVSYLDVHGNLRYCTDGIQLKNSVWAKIQTMIRSLVKEGLITL